MCGIAGILTLDSSVRFSLPHTAIVRAMTDALAHRGPDDAGLWADPHGHAILGHRRLSILDLSPRGHQPMLSPDGHLAISFNGEIYNFQELRAELEADGIAFRTRTDTEVVLRGYERWGEAVVERLVGMFAFAIFDAHARQLFLARDRAGEKPLYFRHVEGQPFAFASELQALECLPVPPMEMSRDAVALYLNFRCVPAPYSIFREVSKLPPAHCLCVNLNGRLRLRRYWDPVPLVHGPRLKISELEAVEALDDLLQQAVRGQMIADVPVGAFLSGGVDSTAVVAAMRAVCPTVEALTVGFESAAFDESLHARAVAESLGTEHTVELLSARAALNLVPKVVGMYGEPFADASALPTHLVCAVARRHVTVCLSGDGGDEVFGGYSTYDRLERLVAPLAALRPFSPLVRPALFAAPIALRERLRAVIGQPIPRVFHHLMSMIAPDDVARMTGRLPAIPEFDRAWLAPRQGRWRADWRRLAMLADTLTYLPESVLAKVDRAAMAVSLETRAPLLDHRLIEFGLQLPTHFVRRKYILRRLLDRHVPRELMDRPKQGFSVPMRDWLAGPLAEPLHDLLSPRVLEPAGIVDFAPVQKLLAQHRAGRRDHSYRLWTLLVLAMWRDQHRAPATAFTAISAL